MDPILNGARDLIALGESIKESGSRNIQLVANQLSKAHLDFLAFAKSVTDWIDTSRATISASANSLSTSSLDLWNNVNLKLNQLHAQVQSTWNQVNDTISDSVTKTTNALLDVKKVILDFIKSVNAQVTALSDWMTEIVDSIQSFINNTPPKIKPAKTLISTPIKTKSLEPDSQKNVAEKKAHIEPKPEPAVVVKDEKDEPIIEQAVLVQAQEVAQVAPSKSDAKGFLIIDLSNLMRRFRSRNSPYCFKCWRTHW